MSLSKILIILAVLGGFGVFAYFGYRRNLRKAKNIERGLKMVPIQIHLPPASLDTGEESADSSDAQRDQIAQAEVMYNLIAGLAETGFKSHFYGQRHLALEIIAVDGLVHFFAAVPVALVDTIEKALITAYPGAKLEEVADHNIFSENGKLPGTHGGELVLKNDASYPIGTYKQVTKDPLMALLNTLGSLQAGEGAGIQILVRPAARAWVKQSNELVANKRKKLSTGLHFGAKDLVKAAVKAPTTDQAQSASKDLSTGELALLEAIEEKTRYPGFETLIRVVTSASDSARSEGILQQVTNSFALFDAPGSNGYKFVPARDIKGLVTAFIFRFFPPELNRDILNSVEMATIFHLPQSKGMATAQVTRLTTKQVDSPPQLTNSGLLLGYNLFRGVKKEIYLSPDDRRRHTYIIGQTGTGKSTMLENLAVQDMLAGGGFCFIDPHGDTSERLMNMIPKSRAEDVIYFNPADTQNPLGLNLFEYSEPAQKDFLIQEAIGMLYKLYDPAHTGIIGPRYEHWFRNAALTLMSDPQGSTFLDVPRVFTDSAFLKEKFKYVADQTVMDFWTKEMAQTSDYHKSEMLGWFVSKFGAFSQNTIMKGIIGQTKSSFNLREVMDSKKILIVNLSKGQIGDLNAQLLGLVFVIKLQAAAMSRASIAEESRADFCLYVDEFQNFSTDSFSTILSEARKYRLNLVVANQFIGQLTEEIKGAVFGNVGTIVSFRSGPEDAEFLARQFAPVFTSQDIANIPNFQAVLRLMSGGLPTQAFSLATLPPIGVSHPEMGQAVKQLSAAKYGRSGAGSPVQTPSVPTPPVAQGAPAGSDSQQPAPKAAPDTLGLTDITGGAPAAIPAIVAQPTPVNPTITPIQPPAQAPVQPPAVPLAVPQTPADLASQPQVATAPSQIAPATPLKAEAQSALEQVLGKPVVAATSPTPIAVTQPIVAVATKQQPPLTQQPLKNPTLPPAQLAKTVAPQRPASAPPLAVPTTSPTVTPGPQMPVVPAQMPGQTPPTTAMPHQDTANARDALGKAPQGVSSANVSIPANPNQPTGVSPVAPTVQSAGPSVPAGEILVDAEGNVIYGDDDSR